MPPVLIWLSNLLPTNPIAVRIVSGGSKRSRHLLLRSGYLAIMISILLLGLLGGDSNGCNNSIGTLKRRDAVIF